MKQDVEIHTEYVSFTTHKRCISWVRDWLLFILSKTVLAAGAALARKKNVRTAGRWRAPLVTIMRALVAEEFRVVKAGKEFVAPEPLDVPAMVRLMEKNEAYIYWLQRPDGDVQAQIAAVKINGLLYGLNMRLEKAIFRHIRLTKNFCNVEVLPDGTRKLRIPQRLFHEKLRTSHRFEVCPPPPIEHPFHLATSQYI